MKKIIISLGLAFGFQVANAQAILKISEDTYDFGKIEEGTQASHTFEVINSGTEPLIISNVQPSCGCTTPDWTKTPIQPGAKGKIMATFNSQGRPGSFHKLITISSNAVEPSRVATIKGFVEAKDTTHYTKEQLDKSPLATLDRSEYNFGKVEEGQAIRQVVKLTNKGKSKLAFKGVQVGCHCVNYTALKPEVNPGEVLEVELLYTPKATGEQLDIVTLSTNDIVNKNIKINLKANVVKSLSNGNMLNQGGMAVPFK